MCGLVGILGSGILAADVKVLKQLIYVDSLRGHHSTGIAAVSATGQISHFKKAVDGPDFLQMKGAEELMRATNLVMFAHNRYATKGAKNSANAHPFEHGHITLCHNGTLRRTAMLPDHTKFDVDSDNLAYAFSQDDPKNVIPKIDGAFALTWWDDNEKTFNIIRNEERPLCIVRHKTRDVVYYASERKMLEMILERNDISTGDYVEIGEGKLISFKVKSGKVEKAVVTTHEVCKEPPIQTSYSTAWGRSQGGRSSNSWRPSADILRENGLAVGDSIEFYSPGVRTFSSVSAVGTLEGTTLDQPYFEVKAYQIAKESLAGVYRGTIQSATETGNAISIVVSAPTLIEIFEHDGNNTDKQDAVDKILKADSVKKIQAA